MIDEKIDAMIHELLEQIDYDTAKGYKEETAEEPKFVEDSMDYPRAIVRRHVCAREPRTEL